MRPSQPVSPATYGGLGRRARRHKEQANGIASAPNAGAKVNVLRAYSKLVNAQTGKSITAANATILITLAKAL